MEIGVIIFWILVVIFGVGLLSILPVATFFLYKLLRERGRLIGKIGLAIFLLTTLGMIAIAAKVIFGPSGFGPEYESVAIEQKIGGKLLCNSVYTADHHSWEYNIRYKFVTFSGDTLDFSGGCYQGRKWKKDEQLQKLGDWLILKTGYLHGSDRIIMRNIKTDSIMVIHNLDNTFIESDSLWKIQNIKSLPNYCCAETFIEQILGGEILLNYKYRTNEASSDTYGNRRIRYRIDPESGNLKMIRIE